MKVSTPEIVWHGKKPVFSADFHRNGPKWRLATGGADNDVKMWRLSEVEGKTRVEFLASLSRHTKAVNVVRFSPNGEYLATASDDSVVCVWKEGSCGGGNLVTEEAASNKESWTVVKALRGHLEDVYDLCWSPDSHMIITGSVDSTAIVWDVVKGERLSMLSESKQYIQGATWDPLGAFVVTFSCDRNMRVYSADSKFKCLHNVNKLSVPDQDGGTRQFRMWADEGLSSFFRRLSFSPDGSLLIVPAGRFEGGDKPRNCTYIFTRSNLTKPVLQLPGPDKPTIVVRCCPVLFEPRVSQGEEDSPAMLFSLPYRVVYAVASSDAVFLYDTQQTAPFGYLSNIHYASITDLAWSNDGHILAVTSSDGYCSLVTFHPGELGSPLEQDKLPSVITQHQCKQPVEAAPGAKSPPPAQSGAKDRERAVSKDSTIKPRRIRPTTITSFGSPEEKQGSKSPSPSSSSTQKQLTSSQDAHVGSTASTTKSPCVEGGIPSTKSPSAEVPQKKPSGPRRVNFVTLSSPAPKHSDSEPMEVQIIE